MPLDVSLKLSAPVPQADILYILYPSQGKSLNHICGLHLNTVRSPGWRFQFGRPLFIIFVSPWQNKPAMTLNRAPTNEDSHLLNGTLSWTEIFSGKLEWKDAAAACCAVVFSIGRWLALPWNRATPARRPDRPDLDGAETRRRSLYRRRPKHFHVRLRALPRAGRARWQAREKHRDQPANTATLRRRTSQADPGGKLGQGNALFPFPGRGQDQVGCRLPAHSAAQGPVRPKPGSAKKTK